MRKVLSDVLERGRVTGQPGTGPYGHFKVLCPVLSRTLNIIASDGRDWFEPVEKPRADILAIAAKANPAILKSLEEKWKDFPPGTVLPPPVFEHASVSAGTCPTWLEMCFVKELLWEPEECVIQYHPPESQYVRDHSTALHLWRIVGVEIPLPPRICV